MSGISKDQAGKFHKALQGVSVELPPVGDTPTPVELRELFREIRNKRNRVMRVLGVVIPVIADLKADLVRLDRLIEELTAVHRNPGSEDGTSFVGCKNEPERTARIKVSLVHEYGDRALVKAQLVRVEGVREHARMIVAELADAFEGASRSLASIELEWKLEHSVR